MHIFASLKLSSLSGIGSLSSVAYLLFVLVGRDNANSFMIAITASPVNKQDEESFTNNM